LHSPLLAADDDGLQELVSLALLVAFLDGLDWVGALLALSADDTLHTQLDAVPALVAVHDIVASDDGGDLANADLLGLVEQLLHVTRAALGVRVAAVAEEVDEDLRHLHLLGDLEQADQVVDVRVDTAVGDEPQQVQTSVALLGAVEGLDDVLDLVQFALLEGLVDADAVLPDDTAGADVQVADLTVAHEALGQADSERRGLEFGVALGRLRVGVREGRHDGGLCGGDGIAVGRGVGAGDTPAVDDD